MVDNVDYNDDFVNGLVSEEDVYSQSAYSVFCTDLTVCAGYAQAFSMICNAAGIDCISVTSSGHQWNKVRINDSWYNVDCTWADAGNGKETYYQYFERSDAVYLNDNAANASSHTTESMWSAYLPACTLDSGSYYHTAGTLPEIMETIILLPLRTIHRMRLFITHRMERFHHHLRQNLICIQIPLRQNQ